MKYFSAYISILINTICFCQDIQSKNRLSSELNEISGLELYNDTTLIAINDGGNEPIIYFLDLKGKILKRTRVINANNIDWEDVTMDDKRNLYIGDVGNNNGNRLDLSILKLNVDQAFLSDSIKVEGIDFSYSDMGVLPPCKKFNIYDCEAIYWKNDSIHLLTKIRTKPANNSFNGTLEYSIPDAGGAYQTAFKYNYRTGGSNRLKHQVTSCDLFNNQLMILTYGYVFFVKPGLPRSFVRNPIKFKRLLQNEGIVGITEEKIIVSAEKHPLLGGPYLYTISLK